MSQVVHKLSHHIFRLEYIVELLRHLTLVAREYLLALSLSRPELRSLVEALRLIVPLHRSVATAILIDCSHHEVRVS